VTLRGLTISNGVAMVDLSGEVAVVGGGSARVGLVNEQIVQTLKQFPTVKDVKISVEGKMLPDGRFQP
jgi:spore germination protein GerM